MDSVVSYHNFRTGQPMNPDIAALIDTLIKAMFTVVAGGVAGVLTALAIMRKSQGDYTKAISDSWASLSTALTGRVDALEKDLVDAQTALKNTRIELTQAQGDLREAQSGILHLRGQVKRLEMENVELRAGVNVLTMQVVAAGQTPVYQPKLTPPQ